MPSCYDRLLELGAKVRPLSFRLFLSSVLSQPQEKSLVRTGEMAQWLKTPGRFFKIALFYVCV